MITFDDVGFCYPHAAGDAVHDINLTLADGSFHFLTGASGAGKTTVFRMLHLDLLPTKGRLLVMGRNVGSLSRDERADMRRKIGVVFQDFRLLPHLTVRENVALPLALAGEITPGQYRAVDDMLAWVGLGKKKDQIASSLSGGEMQRVAVARAVVNKPALLIADEPTGNVDDAMGKRIMHLLTELHKHGTTVLVATHDPRLTEAYPYPLLEMKSGKMTQRIRKGGDAS